MVALLVVMFARACSSSASGWGNEVAYGSLRTIERYLARADLCRGRLHPVRLPLSFAFSTVKTLRPRHGGQLRQVFTSHDVVPRTPRAVPVVVCSHALVLSTSPATPSTRDARSGLSPRSRPRRGQIGLAFVAILLLGNGWRRWQETARRPAAPPLVDRPGLQSGCVKDEGRSQRRGRQANQSGVRIFEFDARTGCAESPRRDAPSSAARPLAAADVSRPAHAGGRATSRHAQPSGHRGQSRICSTR